MHKHPGDMGTQVPLHSEASQPGDQTPSTGLEEGAESDARSVPGDLAVPATHAVRLAPKLQALVYDILPSTTAVFSYAIGPRTSSF